MMLLLGLTDYVGVVSIGRALCQATPTLRPQLTRDSMFVPITVYRTIIPNEVISCFHRI